MKFFEGKFHGGKLKLTKPTSKKGRNPRKKNEQPQSIRPTRLTPGTKQTPLAHEARRLHRAGRQRLRLDRDAHPGLQTRKSGKRNHADAGYKCCVNHRYKFIADSNIKFDGLRSAGSAESADCSAAAGA